MGPAKERWQNVHHHELYNAGHCFTAAAVHCEATGKRNLLEVAVRLADYLCGVFLPTPPALANFGFNPSQIVGLVDLYRVTGERRYLELAGVFVSNRGSEPDPGFNGDLNQDRVPLREETAAVGHAVTATYLWAGAADVYAETGETAVLDALERIWNDVVATKLYLTGAVGADHFSASIRNDPVHEAFGLPHDLPNATAYTETCANIGQGMWAWRMAALTGDARYGDVLEQVLYNSGLSGMSADGTRFCYTNPLRWYGSEPPRHEQRHPGALGYPHLLLLPSAGRPHHRPPAPLGLRPGGRRRLGAPVRRQPPAGGSRRRAPWCWRRRPATPGTAPSPSRWRRRRQNRSRCTCGCRAGRAAPS